MTVVVAEDEVLVRKMVADGLREGGFKVIEAINAEEALIALEATQEVQCLVTDVAMGGQMDGLTLCRRLREDAITRHIPVVVFSILAAGARASDAGARAFLRKPIVESTFVAAVRLAISAQPSDVMEQQWTTR